MNDCLAYPRIRPKSASAIPYVGEIFYIEAAPLRKASRNRMITHGPAPGIYLYMNAKVGAVVRGKL